MKSIVRGIAVTVGLLGAVQAHAIALDPPMLSFTEVVDSSFGSTNVISTSLIGQQSGGSSTNWIDDVVTTYRSVTTPSTTNVKGAVNVYQDVNSNLYTRTVEYNYDAAYYRVSVNEPSQSAGQFIRLTGTVSTTTDTYLTFSLGAGGTFSSTSSDLFGSVAPALPTLGFGLSGIREISTSISPSTYGGRFSESGSLRVYLDANDTYSFNAFVYSPSSDVALHNFSLSILGGDYNKFESTSSAPMMTATTLVASAALPLAPVPEPETYAMLLAGLALIGGIARRRKSN